MAIIAIDGRMPINAADGRQSQSGRIVKPSGPSLSQSCTQPSPTGKPTRPPYFVVAPGATCSNEGAYPAVDEATGDVYVAWEFNVDTNLFVPPCQSQQTQNRVARAPFSCLTLTSRSPCGGPSASWNSLQSIA